MLDINKILSADVLDIIFEGRNKDYGAYELRKTYNKRLTTALLVMAAILAIVFISVLVANFIDANSNSKQMVVQDVQLEEVKQEQKKDEPPPPPPPPKQEPPKVEMAKFTPPKIVKDEEVKEEEKPPEQEKLEDTKIGTANQEGIKDEGIVAPVDNGKGVVEQPKKVEEDWDKTFTKVEIESDYPGGQGAWLRYLQKNLQYPQDAIDNEIQGTVTVQFIVDKEGAVSDVEAISGPNELRSEAIRVIKKSGKWEPAVQNGRKVKSYKKQPITFRLEAN
ncbi:MAG TPA: TonB family protein [Chitinophagaceae bacterium]|nr:TonB family protein [Chitinophagaceae bacterium]